MYRIILLLFCSPWLQVMAQEKFDSLATVSFPIAEGCSFNHPVLLSRFIISSAGLSYARQIEERLSPLVYGGLGFLGNMGYEKIKGHERNLRLQRYQFSIGSYSLSNPISTPLMNARLYSTRVDLHYHYLKKLFKTDENSLGLYLGGSLGIRGLNRFHGNFYNNSTAYTWFAGISGCGEIRYSFEAFNRDWELIVQGQVGLAGLRLQQAYGSMWPEGLLEPGTKTIPGSLKSLKGAGIWNFLSSTWGWHIRYYLENRNFISLGTVSAFHSSPGEGQTRFRLSETGFQLGGGINF